MPGSKPEALTLYQQVADRLEALIDNGTLQPGDRLPSVRRLSRQQDVSISTVLEAYRHLENARLIEARPKSGHYVRGRRSDLPQPSRSATGDGPTSCECRVMALRIVDEASQPHVIPLGAAMPSSALFPLAKLARTLTQVVRDEPGITQSYAPVEGVDELRVQVAKRLLDAGCSVAPDDVLITSGAQEAVQLALRAVTRPGDTVVVESPTYYGLLEAIGSLHLKALEVATDPSDGICLADLERILEREHVAACALGPSFGNPLGHCMPDDRRRALVELLGRHDIPLIEDDVYGELAHEGPRPRAMKAFDDDDRVVTCSSFSKTLAPGWRVGYLVSRRHREQLSLLKFSSTVATATPTQLAVASFLESGGYDHHLRALRRTYRDLLSRVTGAVMEHFPDGTAVTRPAGGHLLWVEMPGGVDSLRVHEDALRQGLSIAPGPIFSPTGRYRQFLRLNCAVPWTPRVDEALGRLGRIVTEAAHSA